MEGGARISFLLNEALSLFLNLLKVNLARLWVFISGPSVQLTTVDNHFTPAFTTSLRMKLLRLREYFSSGAAGKPEITDLEKTNTCCLLVYSENKRLKQQAFTMTFYLIM